MSWGSPISTTSRSERDRECAHPHRPPIDRASHLNEPVGPVCSTCGSGISPSSSRSRCEAGSSATVDCATGSFVRSAGPASAVKWSTRPAPSPPATSPPQSPRQLRRHPKRMTRRSLGELPVSSAFIISPPAPPRFSLGLAARTTSQVYDPGRAFVQARRGGLEALERWGTGERPSHATLTAHSNRGATGAIPIGWDSKGRHHKLGVTPACEGSHRLPVLVVLKNTGGVHGRIRGRGRNLQSGWWRASDRQLHRLRHEPEHRPDPELAQRDERTTHDMEAQMTEILTMLAQQAQTKHQTPEWSAAAGRGVRRVAHGSIGVVRSAVGVQPFCRPPPTARDRAGCCGAAYLSSAAVPDPYEGYSLPRRRTRRARTQGATPGTSSAGPATGAWASLIFQSLTGYGPLYPVDDLVAHLPDGAVQRWRPVDHRRRPELAEPTVVVVRRDAGRRLPGRLAWQTFSFAWTGQQVTCPNTPLPTQFTDPENQPLSMTVTCTRNGNCFFRVVARGLHRPEPGSARRVARRNVAGYLQR